MVSEDCGNAHGGPAFRCCARCSSGARGAARSSRLSVLSVAVRAGIGRWRDSRAFYRQSTVLPDELVDALNQEIRPSPSSEFEGPESQGAALSVPHAGFGDGGDYAHVAGSTLEGEAILSSIYLGEIQSHYDGPVSLQPAALAPARPRDRANVFARSQPAWRDGMLDDQQASTSWRRRCPACSVAEARNRTSGCRQGYAPNRYHLQSERTEHARMTVRLYFSRDIA